MIRPLLIALQFLTRLPVDLRRPPEARETGCSLLFYPLVGLLLGLMLALAAWLLAGLPSLLGSALLLLGWVLLTGGLHLDGLADSADAWAGGQGDHVRMLAIMKDPRSGPLGMVALVLLLLVKFAALGVLLEAGAGLTLLLIPLAGRTALPLLFLTTPYVRPGGLGDPLAAHMPRRAAAGVVVAGYVFMPLALGWTGVWVASAALVVFFCLRALMCRRLGGTTGDTAGALVELTEAGALLCVAILLSVDSP
ncbi:MAG TPA: adenosylcobinamide-GDP ribazoletransferase [Thiobacillus sp.]